MASPLGVGVLALEPRQKSAPNSKVCHCCQPAEDDPRPALAGRIACKAWPAAQQRLPGSPASGCCMTATVRPAKRHRLPESSRRLGKL